MTRRAFLSVAAAGSARASRPPLTVPIRVVLDTKANLPPGLVDNFWSGIWTQAVRDFGRGGVRLQASGQKGEVSRLSLLREPIVTGLDRRTLNLVLTDRIPEQWDNGRAISGVTARYRGHHLCMIALHRAHAHQIPFLSINTCVHELLHALMHDIFERRPRGVFGEAREFRIDLLATRLWLFDDGGAVRQAAQAYLERLREDSERT